MASDLLVISYLEHHYRTSLLDTINGHTITGYHYWTLLMDTIREHCHISLMRDANVLEIGTKPYLVQMTQGTGICLCSCSKTVRFKVRVDTRVRTTGRHFCSTDREIDTCAPGAGGHLRSRYRKLPVF